MKFDENLLTEEEEEINEFEQPKNLRKEERHRERITYPDIYNIASFTKEDILNEMLIGLKRYKDIIYRIKQLTEETIEEGQRFIRHQEILFRDGKEL